MAITFMVGIVLYEQPMPILSILALAGLLYAVNILFLQYQKKERGRDVFLLLLPFFFLAGNFCMRQQVVQMESKMELWEQVVLEHTEVWVKGTIETITKKKSGIYEILLGDCEVIEYITDNNKLEKNVRIINDIGALIVYLNEERVIFYQEKYETLSNSGESDEEENTHLISGKATCVQEQAVEQVYQEKFVKLEIGIGDTVEVCGEGSLPEKTGNLGQFDQYVYYQTKGITGILFGTELRIVEKSKFSIMELFQNWKESILKVYQVSLTEENIGILVAMLLGEKTWLEEETKLLYQQNGISHILAVSGLHVSMLGMAVHQFLLRLRFGRNKSAIIACFFVIAYGCFTQFSISTERAVWMFLCTIIAMLLGKTYDSISALSFSALVTLVFQPMELFSASFLLSYGAVCGVIFYQVIRKNIKFVEPDSSFLWKVNIWNSLCCVFMNIGHFIKHHFMRDKASVRNCSFCIPKDDVPKEMEENVFTSILSKIIDSFEVSLSIQIITFPILLLFFYEISIYSIFLNLLIVPLVSLVLYSGIFTVIFGEIMPILGIFFAGTANVILFVYKILCQWNIRLPFSLVLFGKPQIGLILLYYSFLLILFYGCIHLKRKELLFLLCSLPLLFFISPKSEAEITFLDVSQGDCILIQEKQMGAMLIDCGSTQESNIGTYRLIPYLKAKGISVLEYAVVTHADADHMNGIQEVLQAMLPLTETTSWYHKYNGTIEIRRLILPKLCETDKLYDALVALAEEKNVPVYYVSVQDMITFGKWNLQCLYPTEKVVSKNNGSLVFLASYGELDFMLTGDVEKEGETDILENNTTTLLETKTIEFLKVAHHGSNSSTSEEFLKSVSPTFAIISSGKNNRYGHPHEEVIERLKEYNVFSFYTSKQGAITVKSDGKSYTIHVGKEETKVYEGSCE